MYQAKVVERKTKLAFYVKYFFSLTFYEIMWKHSVQIDRQATHDNMAHAHCMLDT